MKITKYILQYFLALLFLFSPGLVFAMPPGTLLYRTSRDGQMYGYSTDTLISVKNGVMENIFPGHVGIYIGQENGIDYVVEALADGVVKVPAKYFVNLSEGEEFLGAKIPQDLSPTQQAKAVLLAKNIADAHLKYDFDFKHQKGPGSGQWTCVGLVEKIYESANISNPSNLKSLEYDENYYAINITPDGFDNISLMNSDGDCFSEELEFSKIAPQQDVLLPVPELFGFNAGREHDGERYIFLPYTQYLQQTLKDVPVDIELESDFLDEEIRGRVSKAAVILKWSLLNNPLSSGKRIVNNLQSFALHVKEKLFSRPDKTELAFEEIGDETKPVSKEKTKVSKKTPVTKSEEPTQARVKVSKRTAPIVASSTETEKIVEEKQENEPTKIDDILKIDFALAKDLSVKMAATDKTEEHVALVEKEKEVVNNSPVISVSRAPLVASSGGGGSSGVVSDEEDVNDPVIEEDVAEDIVEDIAEDVIVEENWPKLALINEIYSTDTNDWIRLYNPNDQDFDLAEAEYRLEKSKTADDPGLMMRIGNDNDGSYPGGTVIKAQDDYLIVRDEAEEEYLNQADAIATRKEFSWFDSGYTIYVGTGAISSSNDVDVIDALGFGPDATYFIGSGPAPAIPEYYTLQRIATSSDNSLDYELVATDKLPATSTPEVEEDVDLASSTPGLVSIASDNISHLFHFDECYGDGQWAVGKWDCARESGYSYESINIPLDPVVDTNNFSFSFYYRKSRPDVPNISLKLSNGEDHIQVSLDQGLVQLEGLPNSEWRYYDDVPIENDWNQVTLVVSANNNYWALYIDGEELHRVEFDDEMIMANSVEISGSTESFLIDELVFWDRALETEEILANYISDLPYKPLAVAENSGPLELLYSWDFNDNNENVTVDSVYEVELSLSPDFQVSGLEGKALKSVWGEDIELDLPQAISSKDLSLSFWWRNASYPDEGRVKVSLRGNDKDRLALVPDYYRPTYWFNDNFGAISEGVGLSITHDDLWHFLVLTYSSQDYLLRFYVDGEEKFSHPFIWIREEDQADGLRIASENLSSEIDNLSIWQGAMKSEKILELYTNY